MFFNCYAVVNIDVTANGMANGETVNVENLPHQQQPVNGADWVDLFVKEMLSASNIDDARTRASRALELLEKSICERVTTEARGIQQVLTSSFYPATFLGYFVLFYLFFLFF